MVGTSIRPKTIAVLIEFCFTDWLQHLLDALLNDTVLHSGDTQRTHTSIRFWDFYTADCMGMKVLQPLPHIGNQFLRLFLSHFNNSGRVYAFGLTAFVFLDGTICQQDILLAGDPLHQMCENPTVLTSLI